MTEDRVDEAMALWPLDGPYDPERTVDAARTIAELVRYLNHATGPWKSGDCLEFPAQLGSTIGALSAATYSMRQLAEQLGHHADRFGQMGALYDDRGGDPAETVAEAMVGLRNARTHLAAVAAAFDHAQTAANRLGIRD